MSELERREIREAVMVDFFVNIHYHTPMARLRVDSSYVLMSANCLSTLLSEGNIVDDGTPALLDTRHLANLVDERLPGCIFE